MEKRDLHIRVGAPESLSDREIFDALRIGLGLMARKHPEISGIGKIEIGPIPPAAEPAAAGEEADRKIELLRMPEGKGTALVVLKVATDIIERTTHEVYLASVVEAALRNLAAPILGNPVVLGVRILPGGHTWKITPDRGE